MPLVRFTNGVYLMHVVWIKTDAPGVSTWVMAPKRGRNKLREASLYLWSDGVTTWKDERPDLVRVVDYRNAQAAGKLPLEG